MTKYGVYLFVVAIWFTCPVPSIGNGESDLCAHTDQPLACLKANFEKLYSTNYFRFWKIVRQSATDAERCNEMAKTAAFLELALLETNNAEFNEFLSEVIERLASERTDCFLAAASRVDVVAQERIMERLRHPLYVDVAVIDDALKHRIEGPHRPVVDLYFRPRR